MVKHLMTTSLCAVAITACANNRNAEQDFVSPEAFDESMVESRTAAQEASLWTTSPGSLLSMRRAKEVGDILTVIVQMNDQANIQSSLSRNRTSTDSFSVNALFGLPNVADSVLPAGTSLAPAFDYNNQSALTGNGAINRSEQIAFTLAARVVGVEPNGNLIIEGYQQTRVSHEMRYLSVSGVIRTQDITRRNTVEYDKIAEANLSYVNTGEATGPTRRGAVSKVLGRLVPF